MATAGVIRWAVGEEFPSRTGLARVAGDVQLAGRRASSRRAPTSASPISQGNVHQPRARQAGERILCVLSLVERLDATTADRPPRPSWTGASRPSLSWAECPRASCMTIPSWPWRRYWAPAGAQRTRAFTELQSHYLFESPGKGNDKGKVERMVGYVRCNFLMPIPSFDRRH